MYGFQVLRTHDIFILDGKFIARVAVGDDVTAAANLAARTTVGARPGFVQTHIAFAAHSHAKCAVAKHLDAHLVAVRTAHIVFHDSLVHRLHLVHVEFARQHLHISPLGVVAHRLAVAHVHLRGNMHLHINGAGVENGGHVAGDDCRHFCLFRRIHDAVHIFNVFLVDDSVHGEVALHVVLLAPSRYGVQVVEGEVHARTAAHVQILNAEVDGVGTALPCGGE